MIHVYGVVDQLDLLPARRGVDDAPLERLRVGELELVVSRTPGPGAREVTREAVLAHADVVAELTARSRAVLPVQFTAFADEQELAAALGPKTEALGRGLSRVRGCVEFGVRVAGVARAEASSGTDYMRTRLAEEKLAAALHQPLARLSRASRHTRPFESAYLVAEADVAGFREEFGRLRSAHPELTLVCTGPWPPYSFAEEEP